MHEACDESQEPDLVLAVAPAVPRRRTLLDDHRWTPSASVAPACQPPIVSPPVVPPVIGGAEAFQPLVVAGEAAVSPGIWPDRHWWASTGTSLVVHVIALTILALIVATPEIMRRPRPIEIARWGEDQEPQPFFEPEEELAVEMPDPRFDAAVVEPVEQAVALVDDDVVDAVATSFEADDAAPGLVAMDVDGMLARIGGGGAGHGVGGFGGDVGRRLARAGAKSGDIQVSLAWNNGNDLDLHVIAPSGEQIFYGRRRSRCRGTLDVDMNAGGPVSREPVENVFWPARAAPQGAYRVFVHHYARHDRADDTEFELHVLVNGSRRRYTGSTRSGDAPVEVIRFVKAAGGKAEDGFVE